MFGEGGRARDVRYQSRKRTCGKLRAIHKEKRNSFFIQDDNGNENVGCKWRTGGQKESNGWLGL